MSKVFSVFVLVSVLLTACGDDYIPTLDACTEQAEAWCETIDHPTSGCLAVYTRWCTPNGNDGDTMDTSEQLECLEAISENKTPDIIPEACQSMWHVPHGMS